jgi:glycosyltransferase involved in cell wall biosynthesis
MKILQIVHGFPPSNIAGTEIYTYNLSQELSKRHKIFIFYRINNLEMDEYTINQINFDNFTVFGVNNTFRLYASFPMTYRNNIIGKKISLVLEKVKPDIVHIQHLLYLGGEIIKEIKKRNIPIIFTLHDYWLLCPQGQLLDSNFKPCDNKNYSKCVGCISYQLSIRKNIFKYYYFLDRFIPKSIIQLIKNIYLNYAPITFLSSDKLIDMLKKRDEYMKEICSMVDLFIAPSNFLKRKFEQFGIPDDKIIFS